ncbi:uncharacterized protein EV420DRAFT_1636000 [Desarmillaria tabescens]|uniref:Transcription factor domain-containing protein n=1 Tax=Armillaria tabescens TaxID=1929756 RepID=A0AA39TYR7_ARMTA|nr:uncharacterized protein EV420DRAFT_1636000 [Desarmillaria tabescens]KAK0466964.1 hypothetical protein EV420DRAFT_1636000 [Desarmillaria tabescens]
MSVVARMLYSINKGRNMLGLTGKGWKERLVSEIGSSMNAWMDSLPDHLRWDPNCDNTLFLYQSAVLYNTYYVLQIHIHRPSLRADSPLSERSLIISMTGARSCTRILQMGAFISGTILAMNIWSSKRAGRPPNADDLTGFERCLAAFIHAADTWNIARRLLKTLEAMASVETTSIPVTHLRESAAPIYLDGLPEQVQQFSTADLSSFLVEESRLLTDPTYLNSEPLGPTSEDQSQSLFGMGTIDMWTTAPPGFSFAEWDVYVNNMGLEHGQRT